MPKAAANASEQAPLEDADRFLVDRETLLRLVEIIETSAPHLELQVAAAPDGRVTLIERLRAPAPELGPDSDILPVARDIYWSRRRREQRLEAGLFAEPAWDILLDLFIAQATGKRTTLTTACVAAAVPTTTAQRWIRELEVRGLVKREADPGDARRVHIGLTEGGLAKLRRLLREIAPCRA